MRDTHCRIYKANWDGTCMLGSSENKQVLSDCDEFKKADIGYNTAQATN